MDPIWIWLDDHWFWIRGAAVGLVWGAAVAAILALLAGGGAGRDD
jgi:hypothetical protein